MTTINDSLLVGALQVAATPALPISLRLIAGQQLAADRLIREDRLDLPTAKQILDAVRDAYQRINGEPSNLVSEGWLEEITSLADQELLQERDAFDAPRYSASLRATAFLRGYLYAQGGLDELALIPNQER